MSLSFQIILICGVLYKPIVKAPLAIARVPLGIAAVHLFVCLWQAQKLYAEIVINLTFAHRIFIERYVLNAPLLTSLFRLSVRL